jgi:hypothetical protein
MGIYLPALGNIPDSFNVLMVLDNIKTTVGFPLLPYL